MKTSARSLTPYLFFLPSVALVAIFKVIPTLRGIPLSLTAPGPSGPDGGSWSLANYEHMLADPNWHRAVGNAARGVLLLPAFVVIPLAFAFLLFLGLRGWRYYRAVYFLSWILPPVMIGYLFIPVLSTDGILNSVLRAIGLGGLAASWLGDPGLALWALYAVVLWSWFGLGIGIYLAGLATVPQDLFDAARVDGAGFWQMLSRVTIPQLRPTIAYWSVLCTSGLLIGLFPYVFSLTGGGPARATLLPELYIYEVFSKQLNPSYASALGFTLFLLVLVVAFAQVRFMFVKASDA